MAPNVTWRNLPELTWFSYKRTDQCITVGIV